MSVIEMSVTELMNAFRDGLRALIPVFERAKLGWRQEDAYDPWENTAAALFKAIVGSSVDKGVYDSPKLCTQLVLRGPVTLSRRVDLIALNPL